MATKITNDGLTSTIRTQKQELGSAWIMRRALKDNQRYNSWEDITKDKKYMELAGPKGIYPEITSEWIKVFYKQQEKMLDEFGNAKFTEFNREYGFMEFITKLVNEKYKISQKDTWDPADIWCIKNENKVITDIKKFVSNGDFESIGLLNAYLRTLFKDRIVVGISLKKVSGKQAKYVEVNVDGFEFPEPKKPSFDVSYLKIDLSLKPGTNGSKSIPNVQNSIIKAESVNQDGKKITYTIDIGKGSSSKFTFLKFEGKDSSSAQARLGKASIDYVRGLLKEYGYPIDPSASDYPTSSAEYMERENEFIEFFKKINSNKNITTNVSSVDEFSKNMRSLFMNNEKGKPVSANSKCQQLAVYAGLSKLSKKQLDEFATKVIIASQKKGSDAFGPFGKLY